MIKKITKVAIFILVLFATLVNAHPARSLIKSAEVVNSKAKTKGTKLIKKYEDYSEIPYLCPADVWTIGFGTTDGITKDHPRITIEQAELLFQNDLIGFKAAINKHVKVELNKNQFAALLSFVYNVGEKQFSKSTLLKKLNANDYLGASKEFPKWKYAKGKVLQGLINRREAERQLFLSEDF